MNKIQEIICTTSAMIFFLSLIVAFGALFFGPAGLVINICVLIAIISLVICIAATLLFDKVYDWLCKHRKK